MSPEQFPDPLLDAAASSKNEQTAVLAGGCFWCVEAVYRQLDGVTSVTNGYAGGTSNSADYETVSGGRTDHAEAVEVRFDPSKMSFGQILKVFFSIAHDPTTRDRQGPDVGRQYRSVIFYADDEQKGVAEAYIKQLDAAKVFDRPIVTEVVDDGKGALFSKVVNVIPNVNQTLGYDPAVFAKIGLPSRTVPDRTQP